MDWFCLHHLPFAMVSIDLHCPRNRGLLQPARCPLTIASSHVQCQPSGTVSCYLHYLPLNVLSFCDMQVVELDANSMQPFYIQVQQQPEFRWGSLVPDAELPDSESKPLEQVRDTPAVRIDKWTILITSLVYVRVKQLYTSIYWECIRVLYIHRCHLLLPTFLFCKHFHNKSYLGINKGRREGRATLLPHRWVQVITHSVIVIWAYVKCFKIL